MKIVSFTNNQYKHAHADRKVYKNKNLHQRDKLYSKREWIEDTTHFQSEKMFEQDQEELKTELDGIITGVFNYLIFPASEKTNFVDDCFRYPIGYILTMDKTKSGIIKDKCKMFKQSCYRDAGNL